jgi:hypothetical protein
MSMYPSPRAACSTQRREMERFLAQHGRHRRRVRLVRGDLLHRELILPDAIDERGEHDVVEEGVELEVEGRQDVAARLHREDLLDHVRGLRLRDR